jgi:1-acyl-sn-glycerol-3-phosphate acyltransferase
VSFTDSIKRGIQEQQLRLRRRLARLDGFEPERGGPALTLDSTAAECFYAVAERISSAFRIRVEGLEHLPPGRGLLVANHAFGWDVMFLMSRIRREQGRQVWVLGEHAWWKFPYLRRLAREVGTVDGTPENLDTLLARDQLVLVLPGGLREALKPRELRYRLLWGERYGFVRAALRHGAPLVPVASIGSDDMFDLVGDAFARGERWLGRRGIPVPLPARILPIPHLVPLRFVIGDPLAVPAGPEHANDPQILRRFRHEIAGALHELIDVALAERAGIELFRHEPPAP